MPRPYQQHAKRNEKQNAANQQDAKRLVAHGKKVHNQDFGLHKKVLLLPIAN